MTADDMPASTSAEVLAEVRVMRSQLDAITERLARTVTTEVYDIKHAQVEGRLEALESAAERAEASRRQMVVGVGIALIVPAMSLLDDVARWLVGPH